MGGGITELGSASSVTVTGGQNVVISTTKKAKGCAFYWVLSGTTYLGSIYDGVGDNKLWRWDLGAYTTLQATFNDNNITIDPFFSSGSATLRAIIFY